MGSSGASSASADLLSKIEHGDDVHPGGGILNMYVYSPYDGRPFIRKGFFNLALNKHDLAKYWHYRSYQEFLPCLGAVEGAAG